MGQPQDTSRASGGAPRPCWQLPPTPHRGLEAPSLPAGVVSGAGACLAPTGSLQSCGGHGAESRPCWAPRSPCTPRLPSPVEPPPPGTGPSICTTPAPSLGVGRSPGSWAALTLVPSIALPWPRCVGATEPPQDPFDGLQPQGPPPNPPHQLFPLSPPLPAVPGCGLGAQSTRTLHPSPGLARSWARKGGVQGGAVPPDLAINCRGRGPKILLWHPGLQQGGQWGGGRGSAGCWGAAGGCRVLGRCC